ncbi:DMT family transporter [Oleiharenicola lentus]|jgi:drug/metabolite transporter (DMT)-like permease|uniref:DMT family transporter n=1 Tax=Oleiharenicola lentus TaxID=2508720 RepID=A0A4Q1C5S6_9BACT|nr:DMT family transporter [Oleiharenicola lentus]RXK53787.1 DMT family transporter [Oleiharenicola lentus]
MTFSWHLLIPLACAFTYVLAALAFKRAAELGVGVWRTTFVANWTACLAFLPIWLAAGRPVVDLTLYWQPALAAGFFLLGQSCMFLALKHGDVTVTTPVMGTKVIMVALFTVLLNAGAMPLRWWIGAGLSAAAVLLLHLGPGLRGTRHIGRTVFLAWLSASFYGLGDVCIQKWAPGWGATAFAPAMFGWVGIYSLALIPVFSAPLRAMTVSAWKWVGVGSGLMAVNNAGIVLAIGIWGGATAVNIVYSARGLVSVAVVWAIGHWFHSQEQHQEPGVLRNRLIGAGLMLVAIVLVLV